MFKHPKPRPMTWGRFHVHAAKAMPKQVNADYREYVNTGLDDTNEDFMRESFGEHTDKTVKKYGACVKTAYQRALVTVPISVKPYSVAGPTNTLCCADPVITNVRWSGSKERVCFFTITQEICVEIPIHFGAEAFAGVPGVDCLNTSLDDCEDCIETDD